MRGRSERGNKGRINQYGERGKRMEDRRGRGIKKSSNGEREETGKRTNGEREKGGKVISSCGENEEDRKGKRKGRIKVEEDNEGINEVRGR